MKNSKLAIYIIIVGKATTVEPLVGLDSRPGNETSVLLTLVGIWHER